jgi:hypothetical protein
VEQGFDQSVSGALDIEKQALQENPLMSKSQPSLASEILERRNAEDSGKREKEYSMFYLFKRMGIINKAAWRSYLFGTLFAIGMSALFPLLEASPFLTVILQRLDASFPLLVLCGVRETNSPSVCRVDRTPET